MKYWFDTEFIEDGKSIDLISIGMVSEDGRELYLQNQECDFDKASDWVARNVLLQLEEFDLGQRTPMGVDKNRVRSDNAPSYRYEASGWFRESGIWKMKPEIGTAIQDFCIKDAPEGDRPEFWAYYADYDWVVFCQLFGTMMDLPSYFPRYCRDVKQLCDSIGNPQLPTLQTGEHNALKDAIWCKVAYDFLLERIVQSADVSFKILAQRRLVYNKDTRRIETDPPSNVSIIPDADALG